jgi:hypothetical protein
VEVHSFTLSYTPGNMKCDSRASFLIRTFANPCFGHEPEVKVVTHMPFGVKNVPPTYQHVVNMAFKDYFGMFMKVFLDNFNVFNTMIMLS